MFGLSHACPYLNLTIFPRAVGLFPFATKMAAAIPLPQLSPALRDRIWFPTAPGNPPSEMDMAGGVKLMFEVALARSKPHHSLANADGEY